MQHKTYSRRQFLRLSALTAGATVVAGCIAPPVPTQPAGAQNGAAPAQAPTTVRYANFDWWAFTPGVKWDVYHQQEAFPRFREAHPTIDLRWEPFGGYGSGWDSTVLTQIAAGTAPDILSSWTPRYAQRCSMRWWQTAPPSSRQTRSNA